MGVIIFNGVPSTSCGIQVETPPGYHFPKKEYESVHVPGRNGDLIFETGDYENSRREYEISIVDMKKDFYQFTERLVSWLHPKNGYCRLEDTYDPEVYRLARCVDEHDIENIYSHAAKATITFDCKPQRFLKSGDMKSTFTSSNKTMHNPTNQESYPKITVYGSGSGQVMIGSYAIQLSSIDEYVTIDSEIQDVYKDSMNKNSTATLPSGFPKMHPGNNGITFSGGVTSVEVVPRWWAL